MLPGFLYREISLWTEKAFCLLSRAKLTNFTMHSLEFRWSYKGNGLYVRRLEAGR